MCAAVRGFGNGNGPGARVIVAASQWQGKQDVGLGFRWSRGAGRVTVDGWGAQGRAREKPEQSSPSARAKQPPSDAERCKSWRRFME